MILLRSLCIQLVLLLSVLQVNAQQKNPASPFFFIQLTDPQFGMTEADKGFKKETSLYEVAVKAINKLHPDFVVITGDMVNNKADRSQVAEFKRITATISSQIPVYFSPGNHDIGQSPAQADVDSFIKDYGHDRFSFMHKECLFIGLNSVLIKAASPGLEESQFNWLKKELAGGIQAVNIVIFCHYPFFINKPDEPETYSNIAIESRNRYLALFSQYHVRSVFAGHLHNNGYGRSGDMEMVTTSAVGKPLADTPSGIRIVKVYPDKVESSYYSLDAIPETVKLTEK